MMMSKKYTYLSFLSLIWSLVILGITPNVSYAVTKWCKSGKAATEPCACGTQNDYKTCQKGLYCRRETVDSKAMYLCVTAEENEIRNNQAEEAASRGFGADYILPCMNKGKETSICKCGDNELCQSGQSCIFSQKINKKICSGDSIAEQQAAVEIKKQEEAQAKAQAAEAERQRILALPICSANLLIKTECKCGGASCKEGNYCEYSTETRNDDGAEIEITNYKCVKSLNLDNLNRKMENYYKDNNIQAEAVNDGVYELVNQIYQDNLNAEKFIDPDSNEDFKTILNNLEKLAEFTGEDGANKFSKRRWGKGAEDYFKSLDKSLQDLVSKGYINQKDQTLIREYAFKLYQTGADNAKAALENADGGNNYKNTSKKIERLERNVNETMGLVDGACPLIEELRAKYQSGCWSCLVVEKLTSAFMKAAEKAYDLAQNAGFIVLKIGAVLWILLWGLRNVSSFTQLEPANILSELFKFLFKVLLAYMFIASGLKMVGTYFINPIMGFGAKIAEAYWEKEEISPYTEEYVWDYITEEDSKDLDKNVEEAKQKAEENPEATPDAEAKSAAEEEARKKAEEAQKNFAKTPIPNFIIPPVFAGRLTSPAGCRMHPIKKTYTNHKGLDVAGNDGAKIVASGPGTISWKINRGDPSTGYGYYAIITHNSEWSSIYAHMPVYAYKMVPDGSKVVQGQVIGYVGNSGASTGPHLHFEIKHKGRQVDPLRLLNGEIKYIDGSCASQADVNPFPTGFYSGMSVPTSAQTAWTAQKEGIIDLTDFAESGYVPSKMTTTPIPKIEYSGPTTIMSSAVMNSILGATEAIGNITAENMVLGDAIMCYSTLKNGGAWKIGDNKITNFIMWALGVFIFCTGLLLTIAFVYYLLDISFKIGFAVIAMPIVVGLWPFEITKDKFSVCISIIAKSAALFAFLAMATSFTVGMTNAVFNYDTEIEGAELAKKIDDGDTRGLARLYSTFDDASKIEIGAKENTQEHDDNIKYASDKLSWFSTTFVMLLFAFLYSYKLVQNIGPDVVNKFFPDKVFGNSQPMHHLARAASKWVKDTAMKPIGLARDIAIYQGTGLIKKGAKSVAGKVTSKIKQGGKSKPNQNARGEE